MKNREAGPTAVDLVLEEDDAECARLESLLKVTRDDMVDHFIEMLAIQGHPIWQGPGHGTTEERRKAVRTYFQGAM